MEEKSPTIRINWQRLPLAIIGLVGAVGVAVTLILAAFNVVAWSAPLLFAILAVASISGLRLLVLRQKYKPYGYRQTPTAASYQRKVVPGLSPRSTAAEPFDRAEPGTEADAEHDAVPGAERGTGQLDGAVGEGTNPDQQQTSAADEDTEEADQPYAAAESATWEPVDVPAPKYTREAKAERAEPEPLQLPEQPRASVNRLKDTLAAPQDQLREEQERLIRTNVRAHQPKAGALNLDDVLERRRA